MRLSALVAVFLAVVLGSVAGSVVVGIATTAGAAGGDIPPGAVVASDLTACPDGWSPYATANGRVIVGLRPGATLGGAVGGPLGDLERRKHQHSVNLPAIVTSAAGDHSHAAMTYSGGTWAAGNGTPIMSLPIMS